MQAEFHDIGLTDYNKAWELQKNLYEKVLESRNAEPLSYLIFCEHPHVYTLGKYGQANNLLIGNNFLKSIGAQFVQSDRGGDITYHGPGQIVAYPLIDLDAAGYGIRDFIFKIEEAVILTLATYHLHACRMEGATGVWLKGDGKPDRKICAIGVRVNHRITMHGLAFNIMTDLKYFNYINPCGFTDKGVTSLVNEIGSGPDMNEVKNLLKINLSEQLNLKLKQKE
jgi:lipoyl(octanoyl) transferase